MCKEHIVMRALLRKEPQYIRELAKHTQLHPNTVLSVVDSLQQKSLVALQKEDKTFVRFTTTPFTKQYKAFLLIQELYTSGFMEYVEQHYEYPTVILFGSAARGELSAHSDIDMCIISSKQEDMDCSVFNACLPRDLHLFIVTKQEFKAYPKELLQNMLNGVVLMGYMEVL
ncbi:MAG: nucleotidyltransferase domain-containing protein [Candidatus Woesearchaeota archaeon]